MVGKSIRLMEELIKCAIKGYRALEFDGKMGRWASSKIIGD